MELKRVDPNFNRYTVLSMIHEAYIAKGQNQLAEEIYAELSTLEPTPASRATVFIFVPSAVSAIIQNAISRLQANDIDKGLELLREANSISESSVANRFIADILLHKNDKQALEYYRKVYLDYQTDPLYLNTVCYASIKFNDLEYAQRILDDLRIVDPNSQNIIRYQRALQGG